MRQKLLILVGLVFLIALLIGLNAASYVERDDQVDNEIRPNRSTYNPGATGTRAFYEFLTETGRKVTRWQESPTALLNSSNRPDTLVIVGTTRLEIDDSETEKIIRWVWAGGKLVIIDREPPAALLKTSANWTIKNNPSHDATFGVDPSEQIQMTTLTPAIKPTQPSVFTRNVNAVQPSRFASSVQVSFGYTEEKPGTSQLPPTIARATPKYSPTPTPIYELPTPNPKPFPTITPQNLTIESEAAEAPFVHIADDKRAILVDFPYGSGQIVYLTDPYIVSNAGIKLVDNLQLATNIVTSGGGLIAFDEYHQGYGAGENRLISYFSGTPVIPIFAQIGLLIGLLLFSNSRRFARPLPADEPDRLSKLEYVSAMAELQKRTKGYDLAVENIFSEFRRSASRLFGVDNLTTSRKDMAVLISERLKMNELEIYNLMRKCEEIIHGERTNKREVLGLVSKLREIEEKLGIKRTRKQAFGRK
jgi:hypothetical protein